MVTGPRTVFYGLGPAGHELRLMPGPAAGPGSPVPGVGGQQVFQHAAAEAGQPGPDRQFRRLDALPAGQRHGHGGG